MEKITKPHLPDEERYIFTEGINYFSAGEKSIWGEGDKDTLKFLEKTKIISGKWLNLAAGDGRYNLHLLKKADFVVASDIDESALSKLWRTTPKEYVKKLSTKVFDLTKRFPFQDKSFDGIFSAGTLHLFPKNVLAKIIVEITRILKPKGKIILDFATDIKRIMSNGERYIVKGEPQYTLNEAKATLEKLFGNYKLTFYESKVPEEVFNKANPSYIFSCKFWLVVGEKK